MIERALRLIDDDGMSCNATAIALGLAPSTVWKWNHDRRMPHKWRVSGDGGFNFTVAVLAELHALAPWKVPTHEFLLALTADQLERYIQASVDGDGNRHVHDNVKWSETRNLWQKEVPPVESFEFACALAGIATSTEWQAYRGIHRIALKSSTTTKPIEAAAKARRPARQPVLYQGVIWCPTVRKYGNFLARRDGKVFYSGNCLMVDDEGGLQFREPNFWASGNYFLDHSHTDTIPVIDERVQLTDYTRSIPDKDLRSSIVISTDDPEDGIEGTITTSFVPATASELRGMIRPAMWVNEVFNTLEIQQTMAELIALQIYFRSRLGSLTCLGNPMIQVDDQVQILERETAETNIHYVRAHRRTHDHKTGSYLSQLTTNVLSPPGDWVVVKPDGSPSGSIVSNRTI